MKFRTAALAATLAILVTSAHAGISDDIIFCSKISSSRERIACYDAAARVAARKETTAGSLRPATPVTSAPAALPQQSTYMSAHPRNAFEGAFVVAYGSYSPVPRSSTSGFDGIYGPSVGLGAGYNVAVGSMIVGVEARGHYDFIKRTYPGFSSSFELLPPYTVSTFGGTPPFNPFRPSSVTLASGSRSWTVYERTVGGDLSWRTGFTPTDWLLIYGRIGGGVQQFESRTETVSYQIQCRNPTTTIVPLSQFSGRLDVIGCGSVEREQQAAVTSRKGLNPYILVGTGFEANWSNFFLRAEAELNSFFGGGGLSVYAYTGTLGVGFRF